MAITVRLYAFLTHSLAIPIGGLRRNAPKSGQVSDRSSAMPDLIYLLLGLGGFAAFGFVVRLIERM